MLLAERFSGIAAFAHGLAFCEAVEAISGIAPAPRRALALRTVFAELERLRSHAAAITGICNSTALAVATSQAALIEESLLRLSCEITGHRYLFGSVVPGGVACDLSATDCRHLTGAVAEIAQELRNLFQMLRYSSSFLDRLEEVGIVTRGQNPFLWSGRADRTRLRRGSRHPQIVPLRRLRIDQLLRSHRARG